MVHVLSGNLRKDCALFAMANGSPNTFDTLLDATIGYLEQLKAKGQKSVLINPSRIADLKRPVTRDPIPELRSSAPSQLLSTAPIAPPSISFQAAPVLTTAEKELRFAELRERALACTRCDHLVRSRKNVVFGVGSIHAELMFVGEAPGADEDQAGEPFVGAAGQLLTKIINAMGLTRDTVYIANVLKCRPDTPGQAYGNRKPTGQEMEVCLPYLKEQIQLIQPKVIVSLGATALEGLKGQIGLSVTKLRGRWQVYEGIPLMPTFHPSYLLRISDSNDTKRQTWQDMLSVMQKLGMTISEKQRGYFSAAR